MKLEEDFDIKIGGHKYEVKMVDSEEMHRIFSEATGEEPEEDADMFGLLLPPINTILIRKDISPSQREESLIHEIIHAIDPSLGEDTVRSVAFSLYQVLKDNEFLK